MELSILRPDADLSILDAHGCNELPCEVVGVNALIVVIPGGIVVYGCRNLGALPVCIRPVAQLDDIISNLGSRRTGITVSLGQDNVIRADGRHKAPVVFGSGGSQIEAIAPRLITHDKLVRDLSLLRVKIALVAILQLLDGRTFHSTGGIDYHSSLMLQLLDDQLKELCRLSDSELIRLDDRTAALVNIHPEAGAQETLREPRALDPGSGHLGKPWTVRGSDGLVQVIVKLVFLPGVCIRSMISLLGMSSFISPTSRRLLHHLLCGALFRDLVHKHVHISAGYGNLVQVLLVLVDMAIPSGRRGSGVYFDHGTARGAASGCTGFAEALTSRPRVSEIGFCLVFLTHCC